MIEEKIKEDILKVKNTEDDVSGSLIPKGLKERMRDSSEKDTEQPGTSVTIRKPCLKNDLAMMLDSSSEDESQETPENGSAGPVLRRNCYLTAIKKESK